LGRSEETRLKILKTLLKCHDITLFILIFILNIIKLFILDALRWVLYT
jgi:hypothetical protein